jgi:periplasmic glucans biosynthesis protein
MIDRRSFLSGALGLGAVASGNVPGAACAGQGLAFGAPAAFSFEILRERARMLAQSAYLGSSQSAPEVLHQIDYDAHGKIRFKPELALWAEGPGRYPVTFFHLGRYFTTPVHMHVVAEGKAREILYDDDLFDMPPDSPAHRLPRDSGFAGFRLQEARDGTLDWRKNDWVAFLGASYFRAIGELYQYGLSARGLAVNTAVAEAAEEFPDFTHVYFETPGPGSEALTIHALLEGPSVAGAFRFVMRRTAAVTMEVETALFLRQDVARFGVAPLTSMYWFSETAKQTAVDWRPEVHDSDGLALWTGTGERIWRPLNNPTRTIASTFADENPKGFGLLQRDRAFDHYLDGVFYDRRPSLWIEPLGDWGRGSVQLIEIPTDDEIHDNIVAAWVPADPVRAGSAVEFRYRMHWTAEEPFPTQLARCRATRMGNGGQAGTIRPKGVRKFVVEFLGKSLAGLPANVLPEVVPWASRGVFSNVRAEPVPDDVPGHWRAEFDLAVTGTGPVEMRCFLRRGSDVLSETWLCQYHPA